MSNTTAADMLGGRATAPWTGDQVNSLNEYQHSLTGHPFNCPRGHGVATPLIAAAAGWFCSYQPAAGGARCDYRQDWAHGFMADGTWRDSDQRLRRLLDADRQD